MQVRWAGRRALRHALQTRRLSAAFPMDHGKSYLMGAGVSHVKGPSSPEVQEMSIDQLFRRSVQAVPERVAASVPSGPSWTYQELDTRITDLARGLLRLGVVQGDRVGVWMANSLEWLLVQMACARIGAILVCINPAYRKRELLHALNLVEVKVLFINPSVSSSNYVSMLHDLIPELERRSQADCHEPLQCAQIPSLRHVVLAEPETASADTSASSLLSFIQFHDLLEKDGSLVQASVSPDQDINIQFTSGTTGAPKGATLSSRTIVNNATFVGGCMQLAQEDVICVSVPLYHCFGLVMGNMAAFAHQASVVYPARVFNASHTLQAIERFKCTAAYGVPTMFTAMLNDPSFGSYDLSSLRTGIMAGSVCPVETMRQAVDKMNLRELCIAFGSTETGPVSFMSRITDEEQIRCETVGRVMPNTECKVVDEQQRVVPVGTIGELFVRGYLTMNGYWNEPGLTEEAFTPDGFYKSGDLVQLDEQGYLRVKGRKRDMVIRAGENLFPAEIENYILEAPGVLQCQVVGVPDEKYGEELCAVVEADTTSSGDERALEAQIRAYLSSQISHQKIPRYIIFNQSLENFLTVTGKVKKFELAEWAKAELQL